LTTVQRSAFDSIFGAARRADSLLMVPVTALAEPLQPQHDAIWNAANANFRARLTAEQQTLFDKRQARRPRPTNSRR
jgi:hypothetical protein